MNKLLNYDNEIGTPTKPPRLINLKDYSNWKSGFENYVNINDTSTSTQKYGVALFSRDISEGSKESPCNEGSCFVSSSSGCSKNTKCDNHSCSQKVSLKTTYDMMAIIASFLTPYENFIGGKITDPDMIEEDF
ncbi:hypothetical protein L1987_52674 [Smallanthus sonchifolius]|uniref:Uncharacterized protein n=1 Tax=Smallanthus sonchifolius TaxID=185202 RepID=A0ACB9ET77_9ASTR|nr:hypothetical protein L1987_52674 [Smallanthus sonchifolius]